MIFGTAFTGQIKKQEKQYVESKIFCFFIPLTVVSTILVTGFIGTGRQGLELKKSALSVIAGLLRGVITSILILSFITFIIYSDTMFWVLIPTVISAILFVYFWFYFGKTTKRERFVREQFGKQFGLYFMPNWLQPKHAKLFFEDLQEVYISKHNKADWKEKFKSILYKNEEFVLLFCINALENNIDKNKTTEQALEDVITQFSV